jgi:hypothetical protein
MTLLLVAWNSNPKPFIWTATVASIVEKLARCKQTLEKIQAWAKTTRRNLAREDGQGGPKSDLSIHPKFYILPCRMFL